MGQLFYFISSCGILHIQLMNKISKTATDIFYEPSCITTSIVCCHARFIVPNPDRHFSYRYLLTKSLWVLPLKPNNCGSFDYRIGTKSSRSYKEVYRTLAIEVVLSYKLSTTIKNRMVLHTTKNGGITFSAILVPIQLLEKKIRPSLIKLNEITAEVVS